MAKKTAAAKSAAAKRVTVPDDFEVQIDGTPGKLVDVSLTGAQVVTAAAMKPNRLVKVLIPSGETTIACKGKVAWARLEPSKGQMLYRAGIAFTNVDKAALEAFLNLHLA